MRKVTRTVASLLLLLSFLKWGYPSVAARLSMGPTAETQQKVEELEREMQEIGRLIRERQEGGSAAAADGAAWPTPGHVAVTSAFGPRVHPILKVPKLHTGLDIGAPTGAEVVAIMDGTVMWVESLPAYGQIAVIDHGGGLASVYAHLSSVAVQAGERVGRGEGIGRVGSTGAVTGPHLHFEVREDGEPVDPMSVLPKRR